MNVEQMRWAIGPRADYYLERFEKFERAGKSTLPTWNWTAFFFSTPWFTYRRLDGCATANFFLPIVYDAERRMIVVTMVDSSSYIGAKRYAMHAREERGALEWACRTIDLDRKYLPAACRD